MDDLQILELYRAHSEKAIEETSRKYGRYCTGIAYNILHSDEDSEECVNDTWLRAWNTIPPECPKCLAAFLGRITRNLSLNRLKTMSAAKRGGGQFEAALEELRDSVPAPSGVDEAIDDKELSMLLDRFLAGLPAESRVLFVRRYWYMSSIRDIASEYGMSESKVKMSLLRSRKKLRGFLEKEGISL